MTSDNREGRAYTYISDLNELAIEKGIPDQDLFVIYTQLATKIKIDAAANGPAANEPVVIASTQDL